MKMKPIFYPLSVLLCLSLPALAGERSAPSPSSRPAPTPIYKTPTPPKIDGSLDDPCWKQAVPIVTNYLYAGDGKRTDPPPMVARFAWDDRYFYIAYDVFDSDLITVPTGRETGPPGNRRPTSEEYAPEKNLDLVEFFISTGSERAFWEVHHTAGNHLNNHWCELAPPEVLAKIARPSMKDVTIRRDGYIPDDGQATVARAVQLKKRPDGTLSTVNKSDDIDIGYSGEIRLPWSGLGVPASRRRGDGTYDLAGFELPMLAVVLNGNGGTPVYHSSAPGLPRVMFHFSAGLWPRYVLAEKP
jgi:hypothetical protein